MFLLFFIDFESFVLCRIEGERKIIVFKLKSKSSKNVLRHGFFGLAFFIKFLLYLYIVFSLSLRLCIHFVWIQSFLSRKRKSIETPEENAEICELKKIWISQTLHKFSASNDEGENNAESH